MTLLSNANTGLAQPDVFYFGNAIGESGNNPQYALVNATDILAARNNPHTALNPAAITDAVDFNRDGLVDLADMQLAQANATSPLTALRLITVPTMLVEQAAAPAVIAESAASTSSPMKYAMVQTPIEAASARRERRLLIPAPRASSSSSLLTSARVDAVMSRMVGPSLPNGAVDPYWTLFEPPSRRIRPRA